MKENIREILVLPIKEPIKYWEKYWGYYTDKLCDKKDYDIMLDSPRFLIDTIISEIEYNEFRNKDNRKFFKEQLGKWLEQDVVFNKLFGNKVRLLLKRFDDSTCTKYLLSICRQIISEFSSGIYFDNLINHLISIIEVAQSLLYENKKEINKYTELIIAEFIANGFVLKDIKNVLNENDGVLLIQGKVIAAPDEYKTLKKTDFATEELYYEAILAVYNGRSIAEKIAVLKDYYHIVPKECYVLIRLDGIRGNIDYTVNGINIYSPLKKQYIKDKFMSSIEALTYDREFVNAAIPVLHKMVHSSVENAINRLEQIIDILELTYNHSKAISYTDRDIFVVEDGKVISGINFGIGNDIAANTHREFNSYMDSLDISSEEDEFKAVDERVSLLGNEQTNDILKLSTAAHWYQKGKNAKLPEDKLLFHWIAIESVLKIPEIVRCNIVGRKDVSLLQTIQKISCAILAKHHFYRYCIDTYLHLYNLTQNNDNYLDIPEDIIQEASLNMKAGDKISVDKFLANLPKIEANIHDEILKTELHELWIYYSDKSGVELMEREINNEILLIYRMRNLIAHNAVFPKYFIECFAIKAQNYSGAILRCLIGEYQVSHLIIEDILVGIVHRYDEFILNIDNEIKQLYGR